MKYVIPRCEKYLAYWKDVLIKRLKDAMSITDRIQKNTNWIKLDKDILLYYFEVGDLFEDYEERKFHISTKMNRKHIYSITLKREMFFTIMKIQNFT